MIPLNLRLRNFMCYRGDTPSLNLEGVHVACLSGQNGHGKSALLDAITWALWGEARAKSDDDLICMGQSEMEVELEFQAGDGGRYRVIRKRSRPRTARGAGQTGLELEVIGPDGQARAITGGTVRETQRELIRRLSLDYDTFVNSAFLVQGRADAFTLKGPAERKDVLGKILGLGLYDDLETECRELLREAEGKTAQYTRDLEELDRELQQREDLDALVEESQRELDLAQRQSEAQEVATIGLRERQQALLMQARQLEELQRRIAANQAILDRYQSDAATERLAIAGYEDTLRRRDDIVAGQALLVEARKVTEEYTQRLAALRPLDQEAHRLEQEIAKARADLDRDVRLLDAEVQSLRPKADALAQLTTGLVNLTVDETRLAEVQRALEAKQAEVQELSSKTHFLSETNAGLRKEMDGLKARLDQILQAPGAQCPLCGAEMGEEGKAHITGQFKEQGEALADRFRANAQEQRRLEQQLKALQAEAAAENERLTRATSGLTARRATLERELEESRQAGVRLQEAGPDLDERRAALEVGGYAREAQEALTRVREQVAELAYDEAAHRQASARVREWEDFDRQARAVEDADRQLAEATSRLQQAQELGAHFAELIQADLLQREALATGMAGRVAVERDLSAAEEALVHLRSRLSQQQEALGGLRQQQERLEALAGIRKDRQEAQAEARKERDVYSDLVTAFGKRGIQALVIETALPELQDEANRLLGRMTDNRMSLTLETQRQTRAGTTVETLDIRIGDELGTRDYEMFSGGEAFRINFALRIALSKLLARRAGAPMPTLIIDEGFGTQDAGGREKLVEVLNAIQDDFERILVITHIEELKDLFPVRIEIVKTAEGSSLTLVA